MKALLNTENYQMLEKISIFRTTFGEIEDVRVNVQILYFNSKNLFFLMKLIDFEICYHLMISSDDEIV